METALICMGVGWIVNKYGDHFVDLISNKFMSRYTDYLVIERQNSPKGYNAIKTEIEKDQSNINKTKKVFNDTIYELEYGLYSLKNNKNIIYINYNEENVIMYCSKRSNTQLKNFYQSIIQKNCSASDLVPYYLQKGGDWGFPLLRRPVAPKYDNATNEMKLILDDIDKFRNDEALYKSNNRPYRKGYFLYGGAGTGKTSIVEMTAIKYDLSIYSIDLNSPEMNGTVLKNLIASVPLYSIILIDEIDKQLETAHKNNNNYVSEAAILSAIDGAPRLSHGVIIVLTANQMIAFNPALFRPGRIDVTAQFTTLLT